MNRREFSLSMLAAALSPAVFAETGKETQNDSLTFDASRFVRKEIQANGQSMTIRKVDPKDILLISDTEPQDDTMSTAVLA